MFNQLSIRYKLLVLLGVSLGVGLLISSAVALYTTFVAEQQASLRTLRQVAAVTSENMRAALAFRDGHSAQKILHSLQADLTFSTPWRWMSAAACWPSTRRPASRPTVPRAGTNCCCSPRALQQHMDREFTTSSTPLS